MRGELRLYWVPQSAQWYGSRESIHLRHSEHSKISRPFSQGFSQDLWITLWARKRPLMKLLKEYECTHCGEAYYYSFCWGRVEQDSCTWHCEVCRTCQDWRVWHFPCPPTIRLLTSSERLIFPGSYFLAILPFLKPWINNEKPPTLTLENRPLEYSPFPLSIQEHAGKPWDKAKKKLISFGENLGGSLSYQWNPIEHPLFSQNSATWAGTPLTSYDDVLDGLRSTKTSTGLHVESTLFDTVYEKGLSVTDIDMKALLLERHDTCPNWNYTIYPRNSGSNF